MHEFWLLLTPTFYEHTKTSELDTCSHTKEHLLIISIERWLLLDRDML